MRAEGFSPAEQSAPRGLNQATQVAFVMRAAGFRPAEHGNAGIEEAIAVRVNLCSPVPHVFSSVKGHLSDADNRIC